MSTWTLIWITTDTMTDTIMTMPNITKRSLIVGSEKLFQSNNIAYEFSKAHDIILFSYNNDISLKANSKVLYRKVMSKLSEHKYQNVTFMGHGVDCNILYGIYQDKAFVFNAGVLVNYKPVDQSITSTLDDHLDLAQAKIYNFVTKGDKKRPARYLTDHQYVRSLFGTIRSKRLAKEIFGCVVYGAYNQDCLEGEPTKFI